MVITVTTGQGHGKTPLSAFDSALKNAGIHNYNLIYISSIIPTGTVIRTGKFKSSENEYGNRLYVVKAEMRSRETGKYIGAALGWYQLEDGRGVFVEHEGIGETKEAVKSNLYKEVRESLIDLCHNRNFPYYKNNIKVKISLIKIQNKAASTIVAAIYKAEKWEDKNE